ncbi:MAG: outer membrane beta-barrel protein [bacterium]|nr:outer membrane beta-barrel protein [bacterium]
MRVALVLGMAVAMSSIGLEAVFAATNEPSTTTSTETKNPSGMGQGNLLNPEITAFLDMGASVGTDEDNEARNRFTLREAEVDFRAAVTSRADGVLVIAIGEEVEDPFGDVEIGFAFELEEGYLDVHTLPGDLALRGGKFRSALGRNNLLHTHDLPQVTRPLAGEAFLGPEGISRVGVSLSWIGPNPWDEYVHFEGQVVNADAGEEARIFEGAGAKDPAVLGHLKTFLDVGETGSLELGSSFLHTRPSGGRNAGYTAGADLTYLWRDPKASDHRSVLLQGEFLWTRGDFDDGKGSSYWGAYAFAQYQFAQNWYAGFRADYTELPDVDARGRDDYEWGGTSNITWYLAETLRLRLEYQHLERDAVGRENSEDAVLLGVTFFIGAHPPHPYWVNK